MEMINQYYRTFIGLPVKAGPGVLRARLELMESLKGERISWVDPLRYHITVRFLGETRIPDVEKIGKALQSGLQLPDQWMVSTAKAGSFGPRNMPRVIWIGFEDQLPFETLRREVDRVLQSCGIPPMDQPFRAHLTLGRIRSLRDPEAFHRSLERIRERFIERIKFDRLVFYRSEPGRGGPVYTSLLDLEFRE